MHIGLLGGFRVEHDGRAVPVTGAMQLAVLFRLAVDAGTAVSYRSISEDIWSLDAPENTRAALQSIVSRLRSQLPAGVIESTAGGYRLAIARGDVDALVFEDLVAAAASAPSPEDAAALARDALALWTGEPWVPSENFDWFERDLRRDRASAVELAGAVAGAAAVPSRGSVPVPLTALVGRETELAMIADQLAANRLVTIVGTGGAGKTRLALEAAGRARASVLVELAPVGPHEVLAAVLTSTGRELRMVEAPETMGTRDRVIEALAGRDFLLVLDNCEHVIEEAARVAEDLLSVLPRLRILATSREPLAIPGEAFVAVGSLPHPREADIDGAESLLAFAGVELFRQRAAAARGVDLDTADVVTAARICARLDGLPLALELAAAKLRNMSPLEVLNGLEHRFTLLTGGYRTALPRHQTLRAMIDWSWSLLSEEERVVLARLAVFPSGIDAEDAAGVAEAMGLASASVFDSLVDKSLLQRSRGRYRTLETIREYGIERLTETGATTDAREVQARFAANRAREFDRELRGPLIYEAIAWFDAEEDNLAAALRYSVGVPLAEVAVQLATSCAWYWTIRDRSEDARTWFTEIAPLASSVDTDEGHIIALINPVIQAFSATGAADIDPGRAMQQAIELLKPITELPIGAGSHELLQLLPHAIAAFGQVAGESDWMVRVRLPIGEDLGLDPWPCAVLHVMRAAMAQNRGDVAELGEESGVAMRLFEDIGDLWGLALSQQMRAEWLTLQGELDEALLMSQASTENMRRITSSWDLAQQQGLTVSLLTRQGRIAEARTYVQEMLADAERGGSSRAQLQTQITATLLDIWEKDVAAAGNRLTIIDDLTRGWPGLPPQLGAWVEMSKAAVDLLRNDTEAAEAHLRSAVDTAIASHDQPIIGQVAIGVGSLALARGDIPEALRAIDLAAVIIGAHDATYPQVREIEEAARKAGIERTGASAPTRSIALEALKSFVGE